MTAPYRGKANLDSSGTRAMSSGPIIDVFADDNNSCVSLQFPHFSILISVSSSGSRKDTSSCRFQRGKYTHENLPRQVEMQQGDFGRVQGSRVGRQLVGRRVKQKMFISSRR